MAGYASDVAFTPAVKRAQEVLGSREAYARMERGGSWETTITPDVAGFIASLDMFYMATAAADGQPYIQYRGGPQGFLKVLDEKTLAFADFRGNRQYISVGNLSENDKAYLFLMDYVNQTRVKLWGRAEVVTDNDDLLARLTDTAYGGVPERAIVFHLTAWDANCRQHIHRRYLASEVDPVVSALKERIAALEGEVAALRLGQ